MCFWSKKTVFCICFQKHFTYICIIKVAQLFLLRFSQYNQNNFFTDFHK